MAPPDIAPAPKDKTSLSPEAAKEDEQIAAVQKDAKSERGTLAADQTESRAAGKRDELKDEVYDFTEEEKGKYKKAFGKDVEPKALASLTLDELNAAEVKEPGITKMLFKKKEKEASTEKFTSHNNHDVEWQKGLKDLVDENVSEITLYIHPKNLTKAANKTFLESNQAAKDAYAAYQETPPKIIFFERKSTKREGGSFYNNDGYLRIFDGDTWKIEKTLSKQELLTAKAENAHSYGDTEGGSQPVESVQAQGVEQKVEPVRSTDDTTREPLADKMSDSRKLSEGRKEMARKIEEKFLAAGLSKEIAAAAIANVRLESGLNPKSIGPHGKAIGLFQLHEGGVGKGMSVADRQNPDINIAKIINVIKGRRGAVLRKEAKEGADIGRLTYLFCYYIEVPAVDKEKRHQISKARERYARSLFRGESMNA